MSIGALGYVNETDLKASGCRCGQDSPCHQISRAEQLYFQSMVFHYTSVRCIKIWRTEFTVL
jgi:hypothetical protein